MKKKKNFILEEKDFIVKEKIGTQVKKLRLKIQELKTNEYNLQKEIKVLRRENENLSIALSRTQEDYNKERNSWNCEINDVVDKNNKLKETFNEISQINIRKEKYIQYLKEKIFELNNQIIQLQKKIKNMEQSTYNSYNQFENLFFP